MSFVYERKAHFHEVDQAGFVHFSHYFKFVEEAEVDWFINLDIPRYQKKEENPISWPRLETKIEYKKPIKFEDRFSISLDILEVKSKVLHYSFKFNDIGKNLLASGEMKTICCKRQSLGEWKSIEIPQYIRDKLN